MQIPLLSMINSDDQYLCLTSLAGFP